MFEDRRTHSEQGWLQLHIVKIDAELPTPPSLDRLRITIHSDQGTIGRAETFLPGRAGVVAGRISELIRARALIGKNPLDTEALVDRLLIQATGRAGDVESAAVSLVEIACRDLVAQSFGVPVYQLLGGAVRNRIKACGVGWTPAERSPEACANAAREQVSRGFRFLAFEPFGSGTAPIDLTPSSLQHTVRLTEAVRAAVGPEIELRVDLTARLSPADARRLVNAFGRIDPREFADPVAAEHLPMSTDVAISAGPPLTLRAEVFPLLSRRGCDTIRIDLTRCGGFTEARKIAVLAESSGASVALINTSGLLPRASALHLAAPLTNLAYVEVDADPLSPLLDDGDLHLPDGPGLGVIIQSEP